MMGHRIKTGVFCMANIFDYLDWRGDLPFAQVPFCAVDGMILSRLSYLPFDGIVSETTAVSVPLFEVAQVLIEQEETARKVLLQEDLQLLLALAQSIRFQQVRLSAYVNQIDAETQTQFSAMTVALGDGRYFIAFRGTDDTLVGWKEDFNMTFTCPVPAQRSAAVYVERIMRQISGEFLLGGHSKGGNLAVYAAAFCPEELQRRIVAVYNNDGPGFDERVLSTVGYKRICERVQTYVPQSSVVGMLLEHEEAYTIIHSTVGGMGQHNLYSWEVLRDRFVTLDTVTNSSRFVDRTLKQWLSSLMPEERERMVDAVYQMLRETNADTLRELRENKFSSAMSILRSARGLDEEGRRNLLHALGLLFRSAGKSLQSPTALSEVSGEDRAR